MERLEHPGRDVMRRVQDLTSGQYLDMSSDAPTFDVPADIDPDTEMAFLDPVRQGLSFSRCDAGEGFVRAPELKRLSQRQHDERCLVTSGRADDRGRRIYWLCRVER